MSIRKSLAAVALAGLITTSAGCGADTAASPSPSAAPSSPTPTSTTPVTTSAAKLDAGEQFLKVLGQASPPATPPSRSHAVELGQVMAKAVCSKVKYGDQLIVANLTSPLLNAGYGNQDVQWVTTNAQVVALALTLSFCDPRYS